MRIIWILSGILFFSGHCLATDFSQLYPTKTLFQAQEQYRKEIHNLLFQDIKPYLSLEERLTLSKTKISLPLPSKSFGLFAYPLNLSYGKITVPILSIKFFDDLAFAFAWHKHYNLDDRHVTDYVGKLFSNEQPTMTPIMAFGIPEKAKQIDRDIALESNRIVRTALIFMLLHDLAHWHYQHTAYSIISHQRAQAQEQQADNFALDVMARMNILPYGIVHWFKATSSAPNNPSITHPISSERLNFIAKKLKTRSISALTLATSKAQTDPDFHFVISTISTMASHLENKN